MKIHRTSKTNNNEIHKDAASKKVTTHIHLQYKIGGYSGHFFRPLIPTSPPLRPRPSPNKIFNLAINLPGHLQPQHRVLRTVLAALNGDVRV